MGRWCVRGNAAMVAAAVASAWTAPEARAQNFATDRVVIQLAPTANPFPATTLTPPDDAAAPTFVARGPGGALLHDLFRIGAVSIEPVFPSPANAALARSIGLDRFYVIELAPEAEAQNAAAQIAALGGPITRVEALALGGGLLQDDGDDNPDDDPDDPDGGTGDGSDNDPTEPAGPTRPNDPGFAFQYGMENVGQEIPGTPFRPGGAGQPDADLDVPEAWLLHRATPELIIAIVDSGVSPTHVDLAPALLDGYDFVDDDEDTSDSDIRSHGTHVAGVAAAIADNEIGIAGVAAGASILPVRVLDAIGAGDVLAGARGITYAADRGAHVINLSLGYRAESEALHAAVRYAHASGAVLVAAAGNSPGSPVPVPARYMEVIAVSATDHFDRWASFSTYGPEISVSAPGYNIWTTEDTSFNRDGYDDEVGTSMSAPMVAGVAGLIREANPSLTPPQIAAIIESTAQDLGDEGWDERFGHGRVNARAALEVALDVAPCSKADVSTTGFDVGIPDGVVDVADYLFFLNSWLAQAPAADIVGRSAESLPNGVVDHSDFSAFLQFWVRGCDAP